MCLKNMALFPFSELRTEILHEEEAGVTLASACSEDLIGMLY